MDSSAEKFKLTKETVFLGSLILLIVRKCLNPIYSGIGGHQIIAFAPLIVLLFCFDFGKVKNEVLKNLKAFKLEVTLVFFLILNSVLIFANNSLSFSVSAIYETFGVVFYFLLFSFSKLDWKKYLYIIENHLGRIIVGISLLFIVERILITYGFTTARSIRAFFFPSKHFGEVVPSPFLGILGDSLQTGSFLSLLLLNLFDYRFCRGEDSFLERLFSLKEELLKKSEFLNSGILLLGIVVIFELGRLSTTVAFLVFFGLMLAKVFYKNNKKTLFAIFGVMAIALFLSNSFNKVLDYIFIEHILAGFMPKFSGCDSRLFFSFAEIANKSPACSPGEFHLFTPIFHGLGLFAVLPFYILIFASLFFGAKNFLEKTPFSFVLLVNIGFVLLVSLHYPILFYSGFNLILGFCLFMNQKLYESTNS